uniref:Exocyst complex component 2 n=1 Tax=Panagrolaimus sp. JU765 TaxID=591449 RepID=A0AC34RQM3_9BILA
MQGCRVESTNLHRQQFVTELLSILTDKLQSFWKLAQSYLNASDEKYLEKQNDVNQMLTNTINVSSWLMLNALVPTTLPEWVLQQYEDRFVKWLEIDTKLQLHQLLFSLQVLRNCIKSLMDYSFTNDHVLPLIELCMTIRLQTIGLLTNSTSDDILKLNEQENWKTDILGNLSKTILPDLYENKIYEILPSLKHVLSNDGFINEMDLFSKEIYKTLIHGLFIDMITSIKETYDKLLCLNPIRPTNLKSNNQNLNLNTSLNSSNIDDTTSLSSGNGTITNLTEKYFIDIQPPSSRKFLISICNLDYIINHSLPMICKKLNDNGIKFAEIILEKTKMKLVGTRQNLIMKYINRKQAPLISLIETSNYDKLPDNDGEILDGFINS